jgi:hypothetical protein
MSAHRLAPTPHPSASERLQVVLAACCLLTLTPWGTAMAAVVLCLIAARRQARRLLDRSAAMGGGVLAPAQHARALHSSGHRRQAVARP